MRLLIRLLCGNERNGWVNPELLLNVMQLMRPRQGLEIQLGLLVDHTPVEHARNLAALATLEQKADWLLMVDNDQTLPMNMIDLIGQADAARGVNIVSLPTQMIRKTTGTPVLNNWVTYDKGWVDRQSLPDAPGFQEVQNAGAGVMLIRRYAFETLPQPWFKVALDEKTQAPLCGEDDSFCARARTEGLKIHTHSGFPCGHLKTIDLARLVPVASGKI